MTDEPKDDIQARTDERIASIQRAAEAVYEAASVNGAPPGLAPAIHMLTIAIVGITEIAAAQTRIANATERAEALDRTMREKEAEEKSNPKRRFIGQPG